MPAVSRCFLGMRMALMLSSYLMISAVRVEDSETLSAEQQLVRSIIANASTLNLPPSFFRLQIDEAPDPLAQYKKNPETSVVNDLPAKRDKHPFLAVAGKFCEGYGCKLVPERDDYLWYDPGAAEWTAVGHINPGTSVRLRSMSENMESCFLSGCSQGLTCHPQNSPRHHRDPRTFEWNIEGDFRVGGRVALRQGWQENCCLSVINGIYVAALCYPPSVESAKLPSAVWKVVAQGPPVGHWKEIHSGMNAAGNYKYIVGVTETHGNAVSEQLMRALRSSVTGEIGFNAQVSSAKVSTTVELSVQASHGVQTTFAQSVQKEKVHEFWCTKSGSRPESKFWMWQFVVLTPRANGDVLETHTPEIICTFGNASTRGKVVPQCPLAYCADEMCQTCHDGWDQPR